MFFVILIHAWWVAQWDAPPRVAIGMRGRIRGGALQLGLDTWSPCSYHQDWWWWLGGGRFNIVLTIRNIYIETNHPSDAREMSLVIWRLAVRMYLVLSNKSKVKRGEDGLDLSHEFSGFLI